MSGVAVAQSAIWDMPFWERLRGRRAPLWFNLEVTARCANNCRHCYINLPAGDREAAARELTVAELDRIMGEAADLGALWCLLSGGEPLLRSDFSEIYLTAKRRGLLVGLFTSATVVSEEHAQLFRDYPPRDVEVTAYGVTRETYERVTRRPGSFDAFLRGLDRLLAAGVKVRLKAMALRSNVYEMPAIAEFCRARTLDYYRFDPLLHLRYDHNADRNEEIRGERLSAGEIVALERADAARFSALREHCEELIAVEPCQPGCDHLFHCGAGSQSFVVSYDGVFRLCSSLCAPGCTYDLRHGTLAEAWETVLPRVRELRSQRREYLESCRRCPMINLCLWCPAHAHLETGELDAPVPYFCEVAHARAAAIEEAVAAKDTK